ncbi:hypothetical protein THRCLA_04422 [Thraustotheca clavata]|uniref:Transmembrane protein n=1 Tax=Thraustotheca clavata TaxID=74557 RepID=A0A1V9ZZ37_9STRA|nr:hypothetical protein THRCLA_04422 [Thraustotheca clavata]
MYPAWFQQKYTPNNGTGSEVYQGFGLFAFYSTNSLQTPFYASATTLKYSDFCAQHDAGAAAPNWMLGNGNNIAAIVCGSAMNALQYIMAFATGIAALGLIGAIGATYNPATGIAERTVSGGTFIASLLLLTSLILWALQIQQKMYNVDVINSSYLECNNGNGISNWKCWFYGYSFWTAIGSVIGMLITMYASSAGRAEKIRHFRNEYEQDLAIALQQSLEQNNDTYSPRTTAQTQGYTASHYQQQNSQPITGVNPVFFSLGSLGCCTFSMIYPAWFMQKYKETDPALFQGFGIFAFHSTGSLQSPFYASVTTMEYSSFCANQHAGVTAPNWMLGGGTQLQAILCGMSIKGIQYVIMFSVVFAAISLIASIAATYQPAAGWAERVVSSATLAASCLLLAALICWAVQIQQKMLQIDVLSTAYMQCKSSQGSGTKWSCWFYGYSFWAAIGGVCGMLCTMYASSAGRAEKIRHFRKMYEADLAIAMQQSNGDTPAQSQGNYNPPQAAKPPVQPTVYNQPGFAQQPQQPEHQDHSSYEPQFQSYGQNNYNNYSGQYGGGGYPQQDDPYRQPVQPVVGGSGYVRGGIV